MAEERDALRLGKGQGAVLVHQKGRALDLFLNGLVEARFHELFGIGFVLGAEVALEILGVFRFAARLYDLRRFHVQKVVDGALVLPRDRRSAHKKGEKGRADGGKARPKF